MFSKSKDTPPTATVNKKSTATPTAAAKRGGKPTKAAAPSIFSSDLVVEGTLNSEGDIQIDGRIEGNIRSGSLTVGEKATINGEIVANSVTVRGRIVGSIRARRVQLSGTSHVEGDILHNSLSVESGAFFDGNCRHAEDPLTAEMPKTAKTKPAKPAPSSNPIKAKPTNANTSNGISQPKDSIPAAPAKRPVARAIPSALTSPRNT